MNLIMFLKKNLKTNFKHIIMRGLIVFTIILLFSSITFAQKERKFIRKGTSEYENEKYVESEVEYRRALDKDANSFEAQFNLADALIKQEKYNEALEQLQALAGRETDKEKLAKIYHNIGNVHFAQQEIDKSIEAYKKSMINNPLDNETRYNLIAAKKMQQQQQEQQQQNQDQKQDQQQDQNQQDQNQNQNQDQQNQQDQDGDGIPDEKEKQNDDGTTPDQPKDTDKDGTPDYQDKDSDNDGVPDQKEAGQNPSEPKDTDKDGTPDYRDLDSDNDGTPDSKEQQNNDMNKEDAERLLNAIQQDENDLQKEKRKAKDAKVRSIEKNW